MKSLRHSPLSLLQRLLLTVYDAGHHLALPALRLKKHLASSGKAPDKGGASRLDKGLERRAVPADWGKWHVAAQESAPPARPLPLYADHWHDVWIHAASGGEAYLTWELIKQYGAPSAASAQTDSVAPISVLTTSCTDQGLDVLREATAWEEKESPRISCTADYFPFDAPSLMHRALSQTLPKVVVLLETELWPGLLAACADEQVPVLLVNARMSTRSLSHYLLIKDFLRRVAPQRILAISDDDAGRFAALFGEERVGVMHNIKFDRFTAPQAPAFVDSPIATVFKPRTSLCVMGSVREQEEPDVALAIRELHAARPKTCIALCPRHMHRVEAWSKRLDAAGVPWVLRSEVNEPVHPGVTVLWDAFGELNAVYAQARAAFVGGSLAPLGGQNFLEPLAAGIAPCIGPYWKNFAWVGQEIIDQGLVRVVRDGHELAASLVKYLQRPIPQTKVQERFQNYLAERQGGTRQAWDLIREYL